MDGPVILGLVVICACAITLGGFLGFRGFFRTFIDIQDSTRFALLALAGAPAPVVLWLQESHQFTAGIIHISVVAGSFLAATLVGWLLQLYLDD